MSERRLRSDSAGGEGQRRGIIRLSSQRSASLLLDDVDHASTDNHVAPSGVTAGGTGTGNGAGNSRKRALPIPTLQHLAREALLYGLVDGHPVKLSRIVRGEMNDDEVMMADPIPMPLSCRSDDDDDDDDDDCEHPMHPMAISCIPVSTALLYDPSFWSGLISEAARRRLLSDEFLISLCESGIPPAQLELRGGLTDVAVTDRFLVKAPRDFPGQGVMMPPQTFGSASEMLISSLHHLRLSGGSERASSDMAVERLVGANDLETFLHRLSRSASDLQSLTIGPSLLQHELSNTWIGSIKGISSFCTRLRSLELHGLALGGTGRSDSGASIGGTTAPSSISSLFEALARNCQALEQLSFARSSGIQDRHLNALLLELRDGTMSCPNLKDLDLSYTGVGPLAFSALCSRQLGYLDEDGADGSKGIRKLCLDGTGVDHSWLKRILASLPRLEDLSIIHCSNLEAGPEIWDILANSSCKEPRSHLASLAVELWFCSDEICHVATASGAVPVDQYYDDDHQIALAAQYDEMNLEDSLPFLPDSTGDDFISGAPEERGWSCRHCTLINESQAHRCVACNGRRFPHSPAKDEVSAENSLADMDDDDNFDRKQASLYDFPSLERHPLRSFSAILHLVCDENENATTDREASAQAATAISEKIINALPEKLVELRLSICNGDDGALLSHGCMLNSDLASSMVQLHGTTLQELELKSIRFDKSETLYGICVGFKELRSLKLFGVHEFGITTAEMLRLISTSGDRAAAIAGCPNLEILQICLADDITRTSPEYGTGTTNTNGEDDDQSDVSLRSPYLRRLWLEGCNDIVKLDLVEVPSIERLSLVNCSSLTHLEINGPNGDDGFSTLQRLRIRGANLSPYSIASLKLPHLTKLVLEAMAHNEDWEIAKMMEFSSESLTDLRIKHCRLLGDYQQWCPQNPTCTGPAQSLSVLELFRPSESFDVVNFQKLFVSGKLRDLSICEASGLQGDIYGIATTTMSPSKVVSNMLGGGLPKPVDDENLLGVVPIRANIGGGAIDATSSLAATEMLGGRAIERILLEFVESSRNGGSDEYGFPPTLNAFQRKLVHEHAEVLNLEHESVRLNTGMKVVRVRRRTASEAADLFEEGREDSSTVGANNVVDTNEAAAVTPEPQRRAPVNVEPQTVPSNLERALLAAATTPPQVTFAADVEDSSTSEDDDDDDDDMEDGENDTSSSDDESNDSGGEATPATPSPPRVRARSRRELRKAKQAAKRGEVYQFKDAGEDDNGLANSSDDDDDGMDDDTNTAFDPLLQQERFARFDPKALRRLIGLAHKLPVDSNGTAVCVRYLRGACPYQHSKNGGQCRYAHFDVKASTAKKFAPLMDYVCGAAARPSVGSKGSSRRKSRGNNRRNNEEQMLGASFGSSYNSDVGGNLMDVHVGGGGGGRAGGRRRRRKGSVGNEEDALASEDGLSSRGSSPGRSWQRQSPLSSSPRTGSALMRNSDVGGTARLDLKRLVRLEITRCEHLTGAYLNAPCLVRLGVRQCHFLRTLDLIVPRLTTLDVSESFRLEELPLHDDSLRGLRVANLNGCKALNEAFCSRLVNHCRALRQLYIFGSGASEKASNTKIRTRVKTKTARLAKLTAGRPKLTLISTKMQLKNVQAKREEVGGRGGGFVEEADGGLQGLQQYY